MEGTTAHNQLKGKFLGLEPLNLVDEYEEESETEQALYKDTDLSMVEELGEEAPIVSLPKSIGHQLEEFLKVEGSTNNLQKIVLQDEFGLKFVELEHKAVSICDKQPYVDATIPSYLPKLPTSNLLFQHVILHDGNSSFMFDPGGNRQRDPQWFRRFNPLLYNQSLNMSYVYVDKCLRASILDIEQPILSRPTIDIGMAMQGHVYYNYDDRHKVRRTKSVNGFDKGTVSFSDGYANMTHLIFGWLDCPSFGQEIDHMIPLKVRLGESCSGAIGPTRKRYSFRWRDPIPDNESVNISFHEVSYFLVQQKQPKKYVLVRCTHGHNRIGYLIVHYLKHPSLISAAQALRRFTGACAPVIYRPDHIHHMNFASFQIQGDRCMFGKNPMELLDLSCAPSLKESPQTMINVHTDPFVTKTSYVDGDKSVSFQAASTPAILVWMQRLKVFLNIGKVGAKDPSPYDSYSYGNVPSSSLPHMVTLSDGNVVFKYMHYNKKVQRTKVSEYFSCPFCMEKCTSCKGLKYRFSYNYLIGQLFNNGKEEFNPHADGVPLTIGQLFCVNFIMLKYTLKCKRSSYQELLSASNFKVENVIGEEGSSKVHRATFQGDKELTMKTLKPFGVLCPLKMNCASDCFWKARVKQKLPELIGDATSVSADRISHDVFVS